MSDQKDGLEKAVDAVLNRIPPQDKEALTVWLKEVNTIRTDEHMSAQDKLQKIQTLNNGAAIPVFKAIGEEAKASFWDTQDLPTKLGAIGALIGLTFGGAGIAAMGTAIGVPAFILTGAGGIVIGYLIERLNKE